MVGCVCKLSGNHTCHPFVLKQRKEGRNKSDSQTGVAATIMQSLYRFFVVKKELLQKVKISVHHCPALTYGHEHCIITKKARCGIQEDGMSFLCRVAQGGAPIKKG